LLRLKFLFCS